VALKWPNDLVVRGRKVAGILVEAEDLPSHVLAVVVGIGVNCRSHPPIEAAYPPADLAGLGFEVDAEALFDRLAVRMAEGILRWERGSGFAEIRRRWLACCLGFGGPIKVILPGRTIAGRFEALDAMGRIVVACADGSRETVSAGDVFFGEAR
jgi:BirA family biotin operon repressor/biotin-[acetyl-CoA-carboxylase] ligase